MTRLTAGTDVRDEASRPLIQGLLEPGEEVEHQARAGDALIVVTTRRLAVVSAERVALAVDMARVRRIEFDIEKMRPATLVIVTESASDTPQVLVVDPADYGEVADALVIIGLRLAQAS